MGSGLSPRPEGSGDESFLCGGVQRFGPLRRAGHGGAPRIAEGSGEEASQPVPQVALGPHVGGFFLAPDEVAHFLVGRQQIGKLVLRQRIDLFQTDDYRV